MAINLFRATASYRYQGIYYNTYDHDIVLDANSLSAISRSNGNRPIPHFWLDTLCIRVDNNNAKLQTEAINEMVAHYAQATDILILDSEIQSLRIAVLEAAKALRV